MRTALGAVSVIAAGAMLSACAVDPSVPANASRASTVNVRRPVGMHAATTSTPAFSDDPLERFELDRAMNHVRALSRDIGVRVRATSGEDQASRYVARRLQALGYTVRVQRVGVDGDVSHNVVARWPDAIRYPVVVGAHMDTVPRSPGANDNASGVAVLLETARLVAGKRPARFLKFVAFGAEEYGRDGRHHVGSQAFVNRLSREGKRKLAGMVSVDMIADGRPLIVGTAGIGPAVVARTLYRKIRNAGIAATYRVTCDCSDNGPFERAGIPGSFLWSGTEPDYHRPSDTVANMKPRHLLRSGKAVRAFVQALDGRLIRKFRA